MQYQPGSLHLPLSATLTTNIIYPGGPISSIATRAPVGWVPAGELRIIIFHAKLMNNHASTVATISLGRGAAGGPPSVTNAIFVPLLYSMAAGAEKEWNGELVLDGGNVNDYIFGGASTTNIVTLELDYEIGIG